MLLSSMFAVIAGLLFLWMVLSLAIIQLQEWVTTSLGTRAKAMEDAIEQMLANPNLKALFYDHPIIRSLTTIRRTEGTRQAAWLYRQPLTRGFTTFRRSLPSYIPHDQFSLVLVDMILTAGAESSLIQQGLLKVRDDTIVRENMSALDPVIVDLNLLIEYARGAAHTEAGATITKFSLETLEQQIQHFSTRYPQYRSLMDMVLEEALRRKADIDELLKMRSIPKGDTLFARLQRGIMALSVISPELNQTLNALVLNAEIKGSDEDDRMRFAKQEFENWFEDTLDRVSGAFKRYSQNLAFTIAIYLALLLNIDAISLTEYLWREPVVRQAMIQNATNFTMVPTETAITPQQAMQELRIQFADVSLPPLGWDVFETASDTAVNDPSCQLFPKAGQAFGIPIIFTKTCIAPPQSSAETNLLLKLLGILFTSLAARQGAPLWFDVLKRLTTLRLARPI